VAADVPPDPSEQQTDCAADINVETGHLAVTEAMQLGCMSVRLEATSGARSSTVGSLIETAANNSSGLCQGSDVAEAQALFTGEHSTEHWQPHDTQQDEVEAQLFLQGPGDDVQPSSRAAAAVEQPQDANVDSQSADATVEKAADTMTLGPW
jgi:hypothetical protein